MGKYTKRSKKGLEFDYDEYKIIDSYCKSKNIEWFASAWDIDSLNFLKQFNLKYNKVASAMITDLKLLESIAKEKNIPLYQLE